MSGAHARDHDGHGHSHGLVDPSIVRSRAGIRAVSISLAVLLATALLQAFVVVLTGSVALLADLIHNVGDALTAVPLGIAFFLRSARGEKGAGYFVVGPSSSARWSRSGRRSSACSTRSRSRTCGRSRPPEPSASSGTRSPRRSGFTRVSGSTARR